jgi:hypothetical protein
MGMSQEVLAYKDFSPRDVNEQLEFLMVEEKIKFGVPGYKKIWKHYYRNEIEFYIQAAQFVDQMPDLQVNEVLGETGIEIRKQMMASFKEAKN